MESLNKKAQLGQTLTWIVASFIIFTILVIFVIFSAYLVSDKTLDIKSLMSSGVSISKQDFQDISSFKSFESFVNSKINEKKIYDIVANPDAGPADAFKGAAESFLKFYPNSWIRIYPQDEKVSYSSAGYGDYSSGGSCNPETGELSVFYFSSNKIILCKNE
jgi:hypothetical protein